MGLGDWASGLMVRLGAAAGWQGDPVMSPTPIRGATRGVWAALRVSTRQQGCSPLRSSTGLAGCQGDRGHGGVLSSEPPEKDAHWQRGKVWTRGGTFSCDHGRWWLVLASAAASSVVPWGAVGVQACVCVLGSGLLPGPPARPLRGLRHRRNCFGVSQARGATVRRGGHRKPRTPRRERDPRGSSGASVHEPARQARRPLSGDAEGPAAGAGLQGAWGGQGSSCGTSTSTGRAVPPTPGLRPAGGGVTRQGGACAYFPLTFYINFILGPFLICRVLCRGFLRTARPPPPVPSAVGGRHLPHGARAGPGAARVRPRLGFSSFPGALLPLHTASGAPIH